MGKVIEETMLIMVDLKNNNNKFYHVTLGETDTVTKRWGRVGAEGASSTENTGRVGYTRLIAAKQKKGYKVSPVISSGMTVKGKDTNLEEVAKKFLSKDSNDSTISNLITRLVASNQHQIMEQSGGLIKVDNDGTVKTALGIVDLASISSARNLISRMQATTTGREHLLEDYLTIIPQNIGYKRGWEEDFLKTENFVKQIDFLKQLEDAVQWRNTTQKAAADPADEFDLDVHKDLFRMNLAKLSDTGKDFDHVNKMFTDTRNNMHTSRNLKLKNVFAVEDRTGKVAFEEAKSKYGNVQELWHGTKAANVLSILTKGLFVPDSGSGIQITGRMFGSGIYASTESTKALNYANGYWDGNRTNQNCFMFLADVVMGNEFKPSRWDSNSLQTAHKGADRSGKPYQSIHIQGGTCNVRNNEMIVWKTEHFNIKYLAEFGA